MAIEMSLAYNRPHGFAVCLKANSGDELWEQAKRRAGDK
jgi:hypothetical protein